MRNLQSGKFRIVGDGTQTVDLVNVSDVADFILLVLRENKSIGRVYNIAQSGNPTWNEMLKAVTSELEIPMPSKHVPYKLAYLLAAIMEFISKFTRKPPRLSRYAIRLIGQQYNYVTDRMKQELGFTPVIGLLDGIRDCLKEMKN
jgi:nucleoside-diphosphate-sugar epimerase